MLIPFKELFAKHKIKPTHVLHLGSSVGQERESYEAQGIKKVIWVEALPDIYEQLVKNIAKYPKHITFCACVSDVDGEEVTFHRASNESQSSSFLDFGTHAKEHPTVKFVEDLQMKTVRVDTLLKGIELEAGGFANLDLQGVELLALRGMGNLLGRFDFVYIEINREPLYIGCSLVGEIDEFLAIAGFIRVETKWTGANWGDALYVRK
jgi:FkbM family methyltransferase